MDDIVREFVIESAEAMDKYDVLLLALEKDHAGPDGLANVFRIAHTIKGACGFLGFAKLESLTHAGESLLSLLRDGKLAADAGVVSCLLKLGDAVRACLRSIETSGGDAAFDHSALVAEMEALMAGGRTGTAVANPPGTPAGDWSAAEKSPDGSADHVPEAHGEAGRGSDQTIRVDVALLDKLMNLVGELVLVRNQVLQHANDRQKGAAPGAAQQLDLITSELQEGVMKTRMQPIRNVWTRFPRLVRDLAHTCGKEVRLEMDGGGTELDKTILEAIKDPLTHVLRNSIDHGIEPAAERVRAGKPAVGTIRLKAYHKGGQVTIEIGDDGAGIDVAKVAFKAMEKGLVTTERVSRMSDWELAQLIFLPGFSTAEAVTNVSGRGVGMDVVKKHVEGIGGTVDLANRPGQGLTLRIKIPLTLAIIPALIVQAAGQRFAIPQVNVVEVVRLKADAPGKGVEWIQDHPVYRLRGELLPLLRLDDMFRPTYRPLREAIPEDFLAVVQADNAHFGVLLGSVRDTQEIVVKPLSKHLKSAALFAGATIMGDGRVALILDIPGLSLAAGFAREADEAEALAASVAQPETSSGLSVAEENLLLSEVEGLGMYAFPLVSISRLEEISPAALERLGEVDVCQSRGRIMPILRLTDLLEGRRAPLSAAIRTGDQGIKVIVLARGEETVGVVVDRILDVAGSAQIMPALSERPSIRGSAILRGRAVEIVDPEALLGSALATAEIP